MNYQSQVKMIFRRSNIVRDARARSLHVLRNTVNAFNRASAAQPTANAKDAKIMRALSS